VTFEYTLDRETVVIGADEAIRFAPGEFQCGRNRSDERVRAVVLGAPVPTSSAAATEWLTRCERCEVETLHGIRSHDGGTIVSYCTACGNEFSSDERRD
jgi:Zn finger protein HypA/HybF involved in hydrogenase expression